MASGRTREQAVCAQAQASLETPQAICMNLQILQDIIIQHFFRINIDAIAYLWQINIILWGKMMNLWNQRRGWRNQIWYSPPHSRWHPANALPHLSPIYHVQSPPTHHAHSHSSANTIINLIEVNNNMKVIIIWRKNVRRGAIRVKAVNSPYLWVRDHSLQKYKTFKFGFYFIFLYMFKIGFLHELIIIFSYDCTWWLLGHWLFHPILFLFPPIFWWRYQCVLLWYNRYTEV